MSYFDDASLVMIPSGYKTSKVYSVKPTDGTGDLTFTRSNDTATRVNSAGLIEKVRTNLILQSAGFSTASWDKITTTVSANTTANPLDGTVNADTITLGAGTTQKFVAQVISLNGNYTVSVYLKAGTHQYAQILLGTDSNAYANFDLSNGTLGTTLGVTARIVSAGSGWYRCSMAFSTTTADSVFILAIDSPSAFRYSATSSTGTMIAFGYQVETGDIATDYIATTSAAVSVGPVANVPRLDYLGSSCPRLLLEPQRTNLLTYSEQFNNAAWLPQNLSTTANATTSPDGTTSADKLIPTASNALHHTFQAQIAIGGAAYSTFFVKAAEYTKVAIREAWNGTNWASFNLSTGAIITQASGSNATIVSYGNGWYRIGIYSADTTQRHDLYVLNNAYTNTDPSAYSYAGDGTSGIFAWGAQVEEGAYATSYIPTLGAAVTRGADAASKTSASALIGQTEGTVFVDWQIDSMPSAGSYFTFLLTQSAGTFSDIMYVAAYSDGRVQAAVFVGNVIQCNLISSTGFITAGANKFAFGYKANDFVLYANGVQVATDTSGSVPAATAIDLADTSGGKMNYKQALLFKTRLTNAQLAELTTL